MTEPRWLALARTDLGVREAPGIANNPLLIRRFASITKLLGTAYNADSVPWCGAMMAWWMSQCHIPTPPIAIRAKSWATWGQKLDRAIPGAVLVFARDGGGHVALYVGEDAGRFYCLGGNQGDRISIVPIEKARCIAIRWPAGEKPVGTPIQMASAASSSRSEA